MKSVTENDLLINFINTKDMYLIYADLCGVNKDDISIDIKGRVLVIKAKRDFGTTEGFNKTDIITGELLKIINLEDDIVIEKSITEYNNGLLKITIPKVEAKSFTLEIK